MPLAKAGCHLLGTRRCEEGDTRDFTLKTSVGDMEALQTLSAGEWPLGTPSQTTLRLRQGATSVPKATSILDLLSWPGAGVLPLAAPTGLLGLLS